ncbi:MAG: NHL repeat-containing protein [Candidatus Aminicenantes bacterium]
MESESEIKLLMKQKGTPVFSLKLLEKFGGLDVPVEQFFDTPVDLSIDKDGQIYVLDSKDHNIKVFKNNGTFFQTIGREGSGPGEFNRPWIMDIIGNEIYVADCDNRRVQVLTKSGQYQRSFKLPLEFGSGMAFDSKGTLYLNTKGFRSSKLISIYDNQGNLLNEIGTLEGKSFEFYNMTQIKNQIKKGELPDSFKNDLLIIVDHKGDIFAVHRAMNKLRKFSPEGKELAEVEIDAEEYKNIYRAFLRKNEEVEKVPYTYYGLIYVNDLAVDEKGNLYVLMNEPSKMIIYVFSNDGKFKGKLQGVEDEISRIAISSDRILYALGRNTHFIYKFLLDFK